MEVIDNTIALVKAVKDWFKARFSEKTTWAGIVMVALIYAGWDGDRINQLLIALSIASGGLIVLPTSNK